MLEIQSRFMGGSATVKQAERKEKSEKPPALYDLTTLQRDANRLLGFTGFNLGFPLDDEGQRGGHDPPDIEGPVV